MKIKFIDKHGYAMVEMHRQDLFTVARCLNDEDDIDSCEFFRIAGALAELCDGKVKAGDMNAVLLRESRGGAYVEVGRETYAALEEACRILGGGRTPEQVVNGVLAAVKAQGIAEMARMAARGGKAGGRGEG